MKTLEDLSVGETIAGLIYDQQDTPQIYGHLRVDETYGPIIIIAYPDPAALPAEANDEHVEAWSNGRGVPRTLTFMSVEGIASFHDSVIIRKKHNFAGVMQITLRPTSIVYGSWAQDVTGELKACTLHSHIDGLDEWLNQGTVSREVRYNDSGTAGGYTLAAESSDPIVIPLDGIRVELSSPWRAKRERAMNAITTVGQVSTFSESPISVNEHLSIHRRLQALLVLSSGQPVRFLKHYIAPEEGAARSRLMHFSTVQDHVLPLEDMAEWSHILTNDEANPEALTAWLSQDSIWFSRSWSAVQLFERKRFYATDRVVYAGISAENVGPALEPVDGEDYTYKRGNSTQATHVMRCIVHSGLDLTSCPHPIPKLAHAIALNYNKTKHFQPDRTPDPSVSGILGRFFGVVLRHLLVRLAVSPAAGDTTRHRLDSETYKAISGLDYVTLGADDWPTYRVVTEEVAPDDAQQSGEDSDGAGSTHNSAATAQAEPGIGA